MLGAGLGATKLPFSNRQLQAGSPTEETWMLNISIWLQKFPKLKDFGPRSVFLGREFSDEKNVFRQFKI